MRAVSKDIKVLIGLLVILLIASLLASRQQGTSEFEILPRRTTYSARPGGVKALYETLRALDYPVQRSTHKISEGIERRDIVHNLTGNPNLSG